MEKEFVPYEQALALKELGFDEPCLDYFANKIPQNSWSISYNSDDKNRDFESVARPTFSQAFRWFRDKHNLIFNLNCYNFVKPIEYHWSIIWNDEAKGHGLVETYEEAEQACLDKLIEICKTKTNG